MPVPTAPEIKAVILAHHSQGTAWQKITAALSDMVPPPKKSTVNCVIS